MRVISGFFDDYCETKPQQCEAWSKPTNVAVIVDFISTDTLGKRSEVTDITARPLHDRDRHLHASNTAGADFYKVGAFLLAILSAATASLRILTKLPHPQIG
ncbi:hypothetical protein AJ87_43515 [Rhizobium yanglingense]|nr:hypothetical protein AJ87_43515 [Rhizobium yanglingense]